MNLRYIDTHAHLYLDRFEEDRDAVVKRALEAGVEKMYLPNIDLGSLPAVLDLAKAYPDHCFPMLGLHPTDVKSDYREILQEMRELLEEEEYVAIGEIGIDLYWDTTYKYQQERAFFEQISWAKERALPIAVHIREAMDYTLELLEEVQDGDLRGVLHCFTGDYKQAVRALDMGFYLGIGGVLTYKKSGLKEVCARLPLEALVLETDAPFLPPVPHRGKRNESAYIPIIAAALAEAMGRSLEEVAVQTTQNAERLFSRTSLSEV